MFTKFVLLSILTTATYASIKSHMTPGHNTDSNLDKDLLLMTKDEMGEQNRELDLLVEQYKVMRVNDLSQEKMTLDEEQLSKYNYTLAHCLISPTFGLIVQN